MFEHGFGDRFYSYIAHDLLLEKLIVGRTVVTTPFDELRRLGDSLRGIFDTRYLDQAIVMGQVEYRFPIWRRFSG